MSDQTGLTITTWVNLQQDKMSGNDLDFGKSAQGVYIPNRNLRGVCNAGSDIAVDQERISPWRMGSYRHVRYWYRRHKVAQVTILYLNGINFRWFH